MSNSKYKELIGGRWYHEFIKKKFFYTWNCDGNVFFFISFLKNYNYTYIFVTNIFLKYIHTMYIPIKNIFLQLVTLKSRDLDDKTFFKI